MGREALCKSANETAAEERRKAEPQASELDSPVGGDAHQGAETSGTRMVSAQRGCRKTQFEGVGKRYPDLEVSKAAHDARSRPREVCQRPPGGDAELMPASCMCGSDLLDVVDDGEEVPLSVSRGQ